MITLFRKIRQNALTKNKVGKYVLYAIGEIILVVIGILIDSAIVVVEGIHDFMAEGNDFDTAAKKTVKEFSKPIIAGALTTIAIFA